MTEIHIMCKDWFFSGFKLWNIIYKNFCLDILKALQLVVTIRKTSTNPVVTNNCNNKVEYSSLELTTRQEKRRVNRIRTHLGLRYNSVQF